MTARTPEHQEWVDHWKARPHVILLGAGASRAALPNGDKNGRRLPVMNDFVEVLGLSELLEQMGVQNPTSNIEQIYAELAERKNEDLSQLESAVYDYFGSLALPDHATVYDYLVLSATSRVASDLQIRIVELDPRKPL